jgi:glutathione S-transferase
VPALVLDSGRVLVESGAILWDLAEGTPFLPHERAQRFEVLRWLFFEQNEHEPTIAMARFLRRWRDPAAFREVLAFLDARARLVLDRMEDHLGDVPYFAGARYTIADIALYGYTHVAGEGGFDLAPYPRIRAWLGRVRRETGHVTMDAAR